MTDINIAVVGAGIVGLTTALELQNEIRNAKISIYANKFQEDTTSYVAAGIFRPGTSFAGPNVNLTKQWIKDAYQYYYDFLSKSYASKSGITQVSGYIFSSSHKSLVRNSYIEDIVPIYRDATREELKLCPGSWKYGSFFTTILTESKYFLPWAMEEFKCRGGKILNKTIQNLSELSRNDIIINCSGLNAKYLCNDMHVVPIRGQILKVDAPWVKTFFYGDYDAYIIPGFDSVTLGGCRQYESYDLNVSKYDTMAIQDRCYSMLPGLKKAPIKNIFVGLRPHRSPVRVEKEVQVHQGKFMKIVHNYGHGGYGVTTAPGTAKYAVKLAKEMWMNNSKL